jgi:hypothetical protein
VPDCAGCGAMSRTDCLAYEEEKCGRAVHIPANSRLRVLPAHVLASFHASFLCNGFRVGDVGKEGTTRAFPSRPCTVRSRAAFPGATTPGSCTPSRVLGWSRGADAVLVVLGVIVFESAAAELSTSSFVQAIVAQLHTLSFSRSLSRSCRRSTSSLDSSPSLNTPRSSVPRARDDLA